MGNKTGTSTSSVESSPAYKRKQARRRRAQERAWAAKSGPVITLYRPPSKAQSDALKDGEHDG